MQLGDGCDEAQPEAAAGRRALALQSVEATEDILALEFRDAGPAVGHNGDEMLAARREVDVDLRPLWRMAHGVLDQVGEELRQQLAIARDFGVGGIAHVTK